MATISDTQKLLMALDSEITPDRLSTIRDAWNRTQAGHLHARQMLCLLCYHSGPIIVLSNSEI